MLRVFAFGVVLSACSERVPPAAAPPASPPPVGEGAPAPAAAGENTQPAAASPQAPASGASDAAVSPPPPAGTKTLPAVSVQNVGLHVGGGPNDAAGKAPFVRAVEERFPEFLRCYRLIAEPGQSGTFGVDLHIGTSGGPPRVEQPRSGLGGDEFRACVVAVFQSVEFAPVKRPTVVSYSLRFKVDAPE